jgi:hypothetical protein
LIISVALLAFIIFAALGPAKLVPRTGLGWQIDHFTGYFVLTSILCGVWRRVFLVGGVLASFAVFLEIFQCITPDRFSDFMGAFYSVSGVVGATLLTDILLRSRQHIAWSLKNG